MAGSSAAPRGGQGRKHEDLQTKYGTPAGLPPEQVTTLMIRNVPRRYTEEALIAELEAYVSREQYNFLYLPWDTRRASNCGYAFINCVDAATTTSLCQQLNGRTWRLVQSPKDIKAVPAHVQGIALNLAHYMGSSVVEEGYAHSPIVIHNGRKIDFQQARDMYCPPELIEKHRHGGPIYPETSMCSDSSVSAYTASNFGSLEHSLQGLDILSGLPAQPAHDRPLVLGRPKSLPFTFADPSVASAAHARCLEEDDGGLAHIASPQAAPEPDALTRTKLLAMQESQQAQVFRLESYHRAWEKLNRQLQELQSVGVFQLEVPLPA